MTTISSNAPILLGNRFNSNGCSISPVSEGVGTGVLVEFAPRPTNPKLTGESAFEFVEEPNLNVFELNILSEVLVEIVLCGVPDVARECNQTCATAGECLIGGFTRNDIRRCVLLVDDERGFRDREAYPVNCDLRL